MPAEETARGRGTSPPASVRQDGCGGRSAGVPRSPRRRRVRGLSAPEAVVILALLAIVLAISMPRWRAYQSAAAAEAATRELAVLFRGLRHRAVAETRTHGVIFRKEREGWTWAVYRDGDGDGLRKSDRVKGIDECIRGPYLVAQRWPGVRLAVPPGRPAKGPPPGHLDLGNGDPVRLGPHDIVSFTPKGTSSPGSIYLSSGDRYWALVLYGPTVRIRIWEWTPAGWRRQ